MKVFASFGHSVKNPARGNGGAIWVESEDQNQFTACVSEYGDGSNGTAEVNWIAVQSVPSGAQIGTADLNSWTTGTKCKRIDFPQVSIISIYYCCYLFQEISITKKGARQPLPVVLICNLSSRLKIRSLKVGAFLLGLLPASASYRKRKKIGQLRQFSFPCQTLAGQHLSTLFAKIIHRIAYGTSKISK